MELKGYKIDTKNMTLDEVINSVLHEITTNNESEYLISQFTYPNRAFYEVMENHDLVVLDKYKPKLTPLAYEVYRKGGWIKWLDYTKEANERQVALERTTISNNIIQKIMIFVMFLIVGANLLVDYWDYKLNEKQLIEPSRKLQEVQQQLKNIQQEILKLNQFDSLNHAHNDTMGVKHDK